MKDKFSVFGLTAEQSEVLFALQRKLTSNDVLVEGQKKPFIGSNKKGQKQLWLDTWDRSIEDYLKTYGGKSSQTKLSYYDLSAKIKRLDQITQNKVWKYMAFLECVLYSPYYPMKKYLFLFALALTGLCVSCGDDEPEFDLGDVSYGLIPDYEDLDYECKTLPCSCGAQYEVYHKNTYEGVDNLIYDYDRIESYPEGISKSWKLILSYEGAKKAYPMRIGIFEPVEQDCMWTCGCGSEFLMSRAQYKIH